MRVWIVVASVGLLAAGCNVPSTTITIVTGQVSRTEPVRVLPAGGSPTISVNSPAGPIHVKAGDTAKVEAVLHAPTEADLDRIQIDVGGLSFSGVDTITIDWTAVGDPSNLSVTFTITAPKGTFLDLKTGVGSIEVEGFERGLVASTGGGSITVRRTAGDLRLHTGVGTVEVKGAKGTVSAETGGGSIEVADAVGDLRLESSVGTITVTCGTGKVEAKTGGGSVTVRERPGDLAVESKVGTIDVVGAQGSVRAQTGGGSVTVEGDLRGDCLVRSSVGPVEVRLPAAASLTVEGRTETGSVETDFPLALEGKIATRSVRGKIGDGTGGTLRVETGGGSLEIRKR